MSQSGRSAAWDWLWCLGWGIASSAWTISAAGQIGATFDEPIYVKAGLEHWRTGSAARLLRLGTMPLPADVATLPLYLWERCAGTTLDPAAQWERVLPWARAGTLLFWWLLLAYGWRIGRLLAGPWGGRFAVALLATEPSLVTHAGLATTDIAVSACLVALVYHFRVGRDAPWFRRVGVPALWFGLAVLAKASGLVFGVLCLTVVELERVVRTADTSAGIWPGLRSLLARTAPFRRDLRTVVLVGLVLAFAYCGTDGETEPSFISWAHELPDGPAKPVFTWIADHCLIFPNAGEAIMRQVRHNLHGHGAYLLGRVAPRALWYYFPVALTIKLTVAVLFIPVLLAVVDPRALTNWACWTALALLLFSVNCRVQIGIRLVFPLVVFGLVGLGAALADALRRAAGSWREGLLVPAAAAVLVWSVCALGSVWPHGLCYVNELWGSTETGFLRVSEANYDWGQGLPQLADWQRSHGLPELDLWYFGTDPTLPRRPLHVVPFHILPIERPNQIRARLHGPLLAVSLTFLYGSSSEEDPQRNLRAFLQTCRPVARTMTFIIYDVNHAPLAERAR
jgi:hypothetical protein